MNCYFCQKPITSKAKPQYVVDSSWFGNLAILGQAHSACAIYKENCDYVSEGEEKARLKTFLRCGFDQTPFHINAVYLGFDCDSKTELETLNDHQRATLKWWREGPMHLTAEAEAKILSDYQALIRLFRKRCIGGEARALNDSQVVTLKTGIRYSPSTPLTYGVTDADRAEAETLVKRWPGIEVLLKEAEATNTNGLTVSIRTGVSLPTALRGSYLDVRGISPLEPGDPLPEETIRRLRGSA